MSEPRDQRSPAELAERAWNLYLATDARVVGILRRIGLPLLRISLGAVFIWFGALKIAGVTPVADLVADTVYWFDPDWFVPLLGSFEVLVGTFLVVGRLMRLVLLLFALQMIGTFLVFIIQPDVAFQDGNPLRLTVEGEFVVKNLVLLSAGIVVGSRLPRPRPWS
jgi:putative oxidoreductase